MDKSQVKIKYGINENSDPGNILRIGDQSRFSSRNKYITLTERQNQKISHVSSVTTQFEINKLLHLPKIKTNRIQEISE